MDRKAEQSAGSETAVASKPDQSRKCLDIISLAAEKYGPDMYRSMAVYRVDDHLPQNQSQVAFWILRDANKNK